MTQTRLESLGEALCNLLAGVAVAVLVQMVVSRAVGIDATLAQNLLVVAAFSVVSVVRTYVLRRLFERKRVGGGLCAAGRGGLSRGKLSANTSGTRR